jgi:uncharacterized membrane protein YgcG
MRTLWLLPAAFEQAAGPQIVVLMVPATQPEDIAA